MTKWKAVIIITLLLSGYLYVVYIYLFTDTLILILFIQLQHTLFKPNVRYFELIN